MIYQKIIYHRDDGKEIEYLVPVDGEKAIYRANGVINFQAGPGQMGQYPFVFEIPGDNITEAFANLPEAARSAGVAAQAELQKKIGEAQRQIIGPNGMPMTNGRRLND